MTVLMFKARTDHIYRHKACKELIVLASLADVVAMKLCETDASTICHKE